MEQANGLTRYRITNLEKKVDDLDNSIQLLMTNHLPHLKEDMIGLKTRMNVMTAVNIGGIIMGIIISKFLS